MRLGLIARSDRTGLGNQTRNLARLLNPDKVMLIDSSFFNQNEQHPEIYEGYDTTTIQGFPTNRQVVQWLEGLDVVLTCEIFYNMQFVDLAIKMGVKTINQYNWEFADYLRDPSLTLPTLLVAPSTWNIGRARNLWGEHKVRYLPTPVFTNDFSKVRNTNLNRNGKKRFLHIMGRQAVHDRNGTLDIVKALQYSGADYELVIKMQTATDPLYVGADTRIKVDFSMPENEVELYEDFDALILPRRYAGQCLPMTEALCAGMPVIMTDISPNNHILPAHWLCEAQKTSSFMARTLIDVYAANPVLLGQRIDQFATKDLQGDKGLAYNIGYREYSDEVLKQKWLELIEKVHNNSLHTSAPQS